MSNNDILYLYRLADKLENHTDEVGFHPLKEEAKRLRQLAAKEKLEDSVRDTDADDNEMGA
jgi:hypothetical protein